jgi:hypothetical protein
MTDLYSIGQQWKLTIQRRAGSTIVDVGLSHLNRHGNWGGSGVFSVQLADLEAVIKQLKKESKL